MKKAVVMLLVVALLSGFLGSTSARAGEAVVLEMKIGSTIGTINMKQVVLDQAPLIENGRTLVPFRFIGEALGAQIGWNPTNRTATYVLGAKNIVLTIGSLTATVNGVKTTLDVAPKILSTGRTVVPVRFISESIGAKVDWNATTRMVTVTMAATPVVFSGQIKIGVFGPLTGTMGIGGTHQKDGVQFAVDKINAAGGLLGRKLVPIFADTEGNAQNAVTIMNKFLYLDNVLATMGSNNSPEVLAVIDMINKAQTPHIVPSGVAGAITASGSKWIFRITATDVVFAKKIVDYAVNTLKAKKVAIIYDTNDYGQGGKTMVTDNLKADGLTPVLVEGYTTGTKDFSPLLLKVSRAGADATIIWGNYTEGAQLVRQIKQLGIPGQVLLSTGVTVGNFFDLAGDAADNLYGVTCGYSPARTDAVAQAFISQFKEKMGYIPDINNVLAYDAVNVLAKAITAAGKADRSAVRDALANIQNFQAVSGPISFKPNGEGGTAALIFKIVAGKIQLVAP